MELGLFQFIHDAVMRYQQQQDFYEEVRVRLLSVFETLFHDDQSVIAIHSRIKSNDSLREKLLRNKFYLHFADPQSALDNMHDLIGLTIECRFIRNEAELYQRLFSFFHFGNEALSPYHADASIGLNLHMMQPQIQRNGFAIYRIDGTIMHGERPVHFELQIKALVHRFWSEIEHEIVYKNNELIVNDGFIQQLLGSVRDSLDVVDHQMDIICRKIQDTSKRATIGIDEQSFKLLCASSINELVNRKMKESVGFAGDFRKDAAILSQYVYIRYFLEGTNTEVKMVEFLEHLNALSHSDLDFSASIVLEENVEGKTILQRALLEDWIAKMNRDYEWHAFFTVLFAIQSDNSKECMEDFARVISILLIQPHWYGNIFAQYEKETAQRYRDCFEEMLAKAIVEADTIETIHDEKLYAVMEYFRARMTKISESYPQAENLEMRREDICNEMEYEIRRLFQE